MVNVPECPNYLPGAKLSSQGAKILFYRGDQFPSQKQKWWGGNADKAKENVSRPISTICCHYMQLEYVFSTCIATMFKLALIH